MRRVMLTFMSLGLRMKPETFVSQMESATKGPDKALLLARSELAEELVNRSFVEALRPAIAGVHHEAGLYARPWGFRLEDITTEVHLWHGEEDENVPVSVGRYVANAIPNCHARFMEDEGHLSLPCNRMREYLGVLVA